MGQMTCPAGRQRGVGGHLHSLMKITQCADGPVSSSSKHVLKSRLTMTWSTVSFRLTVVVVMLLESQALHALGSTAHLCLMSVHLPSAEAAIKYCVICLSLNCRLLCD